MKIIILFSMLFLFLFSSCGSAEEAPAEAEAAANPVNAGAEVEEVYGIGRIEPENEIISLAVPEAGLVKSLGARDGDMVQKGQLLITLEKEVIDARGQQILRRLDTQRSRLETDRKSLEEVRIRLKNLKESARRSEELASKGLETRQALDDLLRDIALEENAIEQRETVMATSQLQIAEIRQEYEVNRRELALRSVSAPADGQILDMRAHVGGALQGQETFADFAPKGARIVVCEIDELFADRVRAGQQAYIRRTGSQERIGEGEVIYAAPYLKRKSLFAEVAGEQEDRRVREVRVLLRDGEHLLYNSRVECVVRLSKAASISENQ